MINIKTVATSIAAVAVAGACVKEYIARTRPSTRPSTQAELIQEFYSKEFLAFNAAQDVLSDRMMSGDYDDMTDEQVLNEYNVIYANFLNK